VNEIKSTYMMNAPIANHSATKTECRKAPYTKLMTAAVKPKYAGHLLETERLINTDAEKVIKNPRIMIYNFPETS